MLKDPIDLDPAPYSSSEEKELEEHYKMLKKNAKTRKWFTRISRMTALINIPASVMIMELMTKRQSHVLVPLVNSIAVIICVISFVCVIKLGKKDDKIIEKIRKLRFSRYTADIPGTENSRKDKS